MLFTYFFVLCSSLTLSEALFGVVVQTWTLKFDLSCISFGLHHSIPPHLLSDDSVFGLAWYFEFIFSTQLESSSSVRMRQRRSEFPQDETSWTSVKTVSVVEMMISPSCLFLLYALLFIVLKYAANRDIIVTLWAFTLYWLRLYLGHSSFSLSQLTERNAKLAASSCQSGASDVFLKFFFAFCHGSRGTRYPRSKQLDSGIHIFQIFQRTYWFEKCSQLAI